MQHRQLQLVFGMECFYENGGNKRSNIGLETSGGGNRRLNGKKRRIAQNRTRYAAKTQALRRQHALLERKLQKRCVAGHEHIRGSSDAILRHEVQAVNPIATQTIATGVWNGVI